MRQPAFLLALVFVCQLALGDRQYPELWEWRSKQKRRQRSDPEEALPVLNVNSPDSPYALIDDFFADRERNHIKMRSQFEKSYFSGNRTAEIGKLHPKEVWLADGNLLVLKGGATPLGNGFDYPWEPLDDFQAPYREPVLPPVDFVPDDTGVGVPLPPEETDNEISDAQPAKMVDKGPLLFDEESFIHRMVNFHSIRSTSGQQGSGRETTSTTTTTPSPSLLFPADDSLPTSPPESFPLGFKRTDHLARRSTTTTPTTITITTMKAVPATRGSDTPVRQLPPRRRPRLFILSHPERMFRHPPVESNAIDDEIRTRRDDAILSGRRHRGRRLWPPVRHSRASPLPVWTRRSYVGGGGAAGAAAANPGDNYVSFFQGNFAGRSWGYSFGL